MLRVDAGARDQIDACLRHAEAETEFFVVRVLHDGAASLPQGSQRGGNERAGEFALAVIADEERAEPGEAVDDGAMLAMPPSSTGFSEMLCRMRP